jgi:hypothetical protein
MLSKLRELQKSFFGEQNRKRKNELREEIDKIEWEFIEETLKEQGNEVSMNELSKYKRNKSKPFFLWKLYFSDIFKGDNPGFDIVIANPPYVRVQELDHKLIDSYKRAYSFAHKRLDISLLFFEKGLDLLKKDGTLTFISSNQFLVTEYGQKAREGLLKQDIHQLIDFQDLPIFENALTYTSIFIIKKKKGEHINFARINSIDPLERGNIQFQKIKYSDLDDGYWVLDSVNNLDLIRKLKKIPILKDYAESHYGIISGKDDILIINQELAKKEKIEDKYLRQIISPQDISKWHVSIPKVYIIYPYELNNKTTLLSEEILKKNAPNLYNYLLKNKKELELRKDSRENFVGRKDWYGLIRFSSIQIFDKEKIISPTIVKNNKFALENNNLSFSGGKTVVITSDKINLKYLLAILNSKFANYFYHKNTPVKAGGYHNYSATFILEIPIRNVPFDKQKPLIEIVDKITTLVESDKTEQSMIKAYEKKMDKLIYEIYELTSEEIKIIEEYNN